MPPFKTLDEWLSWQEGLHVKDIDLGLERVGEVAHRLGVSKPTHPVITVAGTNGKGSCVALLESIYRAAGYQTGCYTSPHLLQYNERVRINGESVEDGSLCVAFNAVECARERISLSYFEWGTLAALWLFQHEKLDIAILEVGLGGRLDAVNVQNPDLAILSSLAIDHTEWLGTDRESIAAEKAGIMRPGVPVVCGDRNPPSIISQRSNELDAELFVLDRDFGFNLHEGQQLWDWWGPSEINQQQTMPLPALAGDIQLTNAATVLMAVSLFQSRRAVEVQAIRDGLTQVRLPGRFQTVIEPVVTILDIAHNPQAVEALASTLASRPVSGKTTAVFSALSDKDVSSMLCVIKAHIDYWYIARLDSSRGLSVEALAATFAACGISDKIQTSHSIAEAYRMAVMNTVSKDRVVVFGSALTVAAVLQFLQEQGIRV